MSRRNQIDANELRLKQIAHLFLTIDSSPSRYMPTLDNMGLKIQGMSPGFVPMVVFRSMKNRRYLEKVS